MYSTPQSNRSRVAAQSKVKTKLYSWSRVKANIKQVNTLTEDEDRSTGYIGVSPPCLQTEATISVTGCRLHDWEGLLRPGISSRLQQEGPIRRQQWERPIWRQQQVAGYRQGQGRRYKATVKQVISTKSGVGMLQAQSVEQWTAKQEAQDSNPVYIASLFPFLQTESVRPKNFLCIYGLMTILYSGHDHVIINHLCMPGIIATVHY